MAEASSETWGQDFCYRGFGQRQCQDVEPRLNAIVDLVGFLEPQTGRSSNMFFFLYPLCLDTFFFIVFSSM